MLSDVRLVVVLASLAWLCGATPIWPTEASRAALAAEDSVRSSAQPSDTAAALFDEVWRTVKDHFYDHRCTAWTGQRCAGATSQLSWRHRQTRRGQRTSIPCSPSLEPRIPGSIPRGPRLLPAHRYLFRQIAPRRVAARFSRWRSDLSRDRDFQPVRQPAAHVHHGRHRGHASRAGRLAGRRRDPGCRRHAISSDWLIPGQGRRAGRLTVRRIVDGPQFEVSVVPVDIRPNQMFLQGLEASARIIEGARGAQSAMCMSGPMPAARISGRSNA